jgi:Domain of unknown function (DUF4331)
MNTWPSSISQASIDRASSSRTWLTLAMASLVWILGSPAAHAADHNDPNAVNSIFADINPDPADLYDMFGFPADTTDGTDRVVLSLTFASIPATGVLDPDLLYRVMMYPGARAVRPDRDGSLESMLEYAAAVKEKYLHSKAAEVRVRAEGNGKAKVDFIGFPEGDFSETIALNSAQTLKSPAGQALQVFVGGRDDAFFNDLPGFFRSINHAPQYYLVPHAMQDKRELAIPKTLLELEGNTLFNFDPARPDLGSTLKEALPTTPLVWKGDRFSKDANGNYRFVYSGRDAQMGRNINTVTLELPLTFITRNPKQDRIVNAWGESWVLKASNKVELIADESRSWWRRLWDWIKSWFSTPTTFEAELTQYKRVDTDGVPFADAALNERIDERQIGANNEKLGRDFVMRLGHLGWGFGPSISALGLGTCFDHDNAPVSIDRTYKLATEAFPRVKKCLFQDVNMPDDSWNKRGLNIPLKRSFEIFIPNVCAVDMDTNGTWPFGRRLEDQVANRFLAIFLDMDKGCSGGKCNVETFSQQALWDAAPIEPKTSPNPLANDVQFLSTFPYLADPH